MSMVVERVSLDRVKDRLAKLKRNKPEKIIQQTQQKETIEEKK